MTESILEADLKDADILIVDDRPENLWTAARSAAPSRRTRAWPTGTGSS